MDIVFVVLILLFSVIGFAKGGARMTASFLSMALSVVVSFMIYKNVATFLYGVANVGGLIEEWVEGVLDERFSVSFTNAGQIQSCLNESLVGRLFLDLFGEELNGLQFGEGLGFGQVFSEKVSVIIVQVVSFALVFVCLKIILKIIFGIFVKIFYKSVHLKYFDRIVGMVVGGGKGVLLVVLCCVILVKISTLMLNDEMFLFVSSSRVATFVFGNVEKFLI